MHNETEIERILSKGLSNTSKLKSLWAFVNDAFLDNMRQYPQLGFQEAKRYEQPEDFIEEMGPNGVTFIQYASESRESDGSAKIIATAGCKPWNKASKLDERVQRMRRERVAREMSSTDGPNRDSEGFYTKAHEDQLLQQLEKVGPMTHDDGDDSVPRWEVMTVCVHPERQKQGLAGKLMKMVTEEVASQVKSQGKGPEFKLVVRAMKETNEKYWVGKGFKIVAEKCFEPGLFGSPTGFHIVDLTQDHRTAEEIA
ncbi:MAG: hypothetical protein LQ338_000457 [Usnochroma carphineum]|nr:MAG: hypothetical protein LQ338_000457 [Usnochroma carphineum]